MKKKKIKLPSRLAALKPTAAASESFKDMKAIHSASLKLHEFNMKLVQNPYNNITRQDGSRKIELEVSFYDPANKKNSRFGLHYSQNSFDDTKHWTKDHTIDDHVTVDRNAKSKPKALNKLLGKIQLEVALRHKMRHIALSNVTLDGYFANRIDFNQQSYGPYYKQYHMKYDKDASGRYYKHKGGKYEGQYAETMVQKEFTKKELKLLKYQIKLNPHLDQRTQLAILGIHHNDFNFHLEHKYAGDNIIHKTPTLNALENPVKIYKKGSHPISVKPTLGETLGKKVTTKRSPLSKRSLLSKFEISKRISEGMKRSLKLFRKK